MKSLQKLIRFTMQQPICLLLLMLVSVQSGFAQSATINNPLAIGQNCGGGGNNFKSFNYDSTTRKLTQIGSNCNPNLQSPGFNPGGGSIAFSPKDQKVYYIETTTGNNSIVWSWTPGTCPIANQPPIYTYASTFIVGLEFNTLTGDGYQLEFSTGASPYNIYLRKVTSFGPPLVAGAPVQIVLPGGKKIWQQNGDIAITPTGKMYFILDNKMFNLDYSTYGSGFLNANYIDTIKNGAGNNVIGLSYSDDKFIASVSNSGSTCFYDQIDISSGAAVVKPVTLASGTFIAYDMATMVTGIGAAKKLASLQKTGALTYQAVYDIKVKNYGNVNLNAVQLTDDIKTAFGASFVNATVAAVGSLPTGVSLNTFYNGSTVTSIFAVGSTMKATPADSATVRITVNLNNPNISSTYYNSAIATATGAIFLNSVRDSSDNQPTLNPDISGTDVPDLKGEGIPTPITPVGWLLLDNNLLNFNAIRSGSNVNLSWAIDNQVNGTGINIQRSTDGLNFETIGQIKAQTMAKQDYTWHDAQQLGDNNYYYRLELSTPSGSKTNSSLVIIRKSDRPVVLNVSPNPFIQSVKVNIGLEKAEKITYKIRDFVSTILQQGDYDGHAGQNEIQITNLTRVPAGANILEVIVGDKHYFQKIIKLQ